MSKMTPDKIRKLALKGRLVPIVEQRNGKMYLIGYGRKATSRKREQYMLPEPQELTNNQ